MSWVGNWLGGFAGGDDDETSPAPVPIPETPTIGAVIERDDAVARAIDRLPAQFRSDP